MKNAQISRPLNEGFSDEDLQKLTNWIIDVYSETNSYPNIISIIENNQEIIKVNF